MSLTHKFSIIIPPQDIACKPGLLESLAGGDKEAFEWIYKNYSKKIYDYALLITGNEVMSEDVVQETFLKIWQHREKLKTIENFNNYLFILYRNLILDIMKKQKKEISVRHEYSRNMEADITADDTLNYKETQQMISSAVNQLPQQRQMVYRLGREYGWKRNEIAKELDIAPNTVKAQMQNSLRFLKQYVLDRME